MMPNRCRSPGGYAALACGWRAAILAGTLFIGGCYTYGAPRGPAPAPGTHVSIHLSRDATSDLALQLGPGVSFVEGVVLADDSAGLHLAVSRVEGRGGAPETPWTGERFTFPHDTYLSLEERHLSLPAMILTGGLAVGAVVAIHQAFNGGGTANSPPTSVANPTQ